MPTIAIYPRKSRFTGKGESVQTQIELCRQYCDAHFDSPSYLIYDEDEGYSGGNVRRPAFQRMLKDARDHKIDILCCYRIDRISRNVSDFSRTLDELHSLGVSFVSLREQFDTSTPMGRAMIYIASVFAQLERDTLTERINDNLQALAKEGRWLGGTTPTGYRSKRVDVERGGRKRRYNILSAYEPELETIRLLYAQYREKRSLAGVETYCLQHCIKTRNGRDFSRATIKAILQNPVYCTADADAWTYFSRGDYNLCADESDFDGMHGIQPFSRTESERPSSVLKPTSEWIIAVGQHPGAISGADWAEVQKHLRAAKDSTYGAPRTKTALLSGLIVCAHCGSYMRPKTHSRVREDGTRGVSYTCALKSSSRGERCAMKSADALEVNRLVLEKLSELSGERGAFARQASVDLIETTNRRADLQRQLEDANTELAEMRDKQRKLIDRLTDLTLSKIVVKSISDEYDRLEAAAIEAEAQTGRIRQELDACEDQADVLDMMQRLMGSFGKSFSDLDFDEKRRLLKAVVERVVWDGDNITIELFGEKRLPK